jgi:hypothetical protein
MSYRDRKLSGVFLCVFSCAASASTLVLRILDQSGRVAGLISSIWDGEILKILKPGLAWKSLWLAKLQSQTLPLHAAEDRDLYCPQVVQLLE